MYKEDLALNNLQWLICHKTKPNQIREETFCKNSDFLLQFMYLHHLSFWFRKTKDYTSESKVLQYFSSI